MASLGVMSEVRWRKTYLDDPCRGPLLAAKHPLCPDDASRWVYCPVENIHSHNMRTVGIGVLMPHPNDYMRPRVTKKGHTGVSRSIKQVAEGNGYALIVE